MIRLWMWELVLLIRVFLRERFGIIVSKDVVPKNVAPRNVAPKNVTSTSIPPKSH
jgi:hypothetical protein